MNEPLVVNMSNLLGQYYDRVCMNYLKSIDPRYETTVYYYYRNTTNLTYISNYSFVDTYIKNLIDTYKSIIDEKMVEGIQAINDKVYKKNNINLPSHNKNTYDLNQVELENQPGIDVSNDPIKDFRFLIQNTYIFRSSVYKIDMDPCISILCDLDKDLDKYGNWIDYGHEDGYPEFYDVVSNCYNNYFHQYIKYNFAVNSNLTANNYVHFTKLDTNDKTIAFLANLLVMVRYECESIFHNMLLDISLDKAKNEYMESIKDEHIQLNQKAEEAHKIMVKSIEESRSSQHNLSKLQVQIDSEKLAKKSLEKNFLSKMANLNKENKKLKNQLEQLKAKYEDLDIYHKNVIDNAFIDMTDEEIPEIDTTKNYVFVSGKETEHMGVIRDIIVEFPNSTVKYSNFKVLANSTDLVVFLTSFMDHSTYYDIKNQCIAKDIPYVHCHTRNIKDIKRAISIIRKD